MLIVLPFFFAVGFGVGYIWPGWDAVRASPENTARWLLGALIALVAIIVTLAVLPTPQAFSGELLTLACILVGSLAGNWFKDPTGSRDKLAFLAGAAAFLFLAALEYSQVQSTKSNNQSPIPSTSGNGEDFLNGAFPGGAGTDIAVGYLASLPNTIIQRRAVCEFAFSGGHFCRTN